MECGLCLGSCGGSCGGVAMQNLCAACSAEQAAAMATLTRLVAIRKSSGEDMRDDDTSTPPPMPARRTPPPVTRRYRVMRLSPPPRAVPFRGFDSPVPAAAPAAATTAPTTPVVAQPRRLAMID